jgi:hypothetical protein
MALTGMDEALVRLTEADAGSDLSALSRVAWDLYALAGLSEAAVTRLRAELHDNTQPRGSGTDGNH